MTNMLTITIIFAMVILAIIIFLNIIHNGLSRSLLIQVPLLLSPVSASAFMLTSDLEILRESVEISSNGRACTTWTREYS